MSRAEQGRSRSTGVQHRRDRARPTAPVALDLRCDCGSLLARLLAGDLELKCRRCKRVVVLTLPSDPAHCGPGSDGPRLPSDLLSRLHCTCGEGSP